MSRLRKLGDESGGTTDGDEPFVPRRMKGFYCSVEKTMSTPQKMGQSRVRKRLLTGLRPTGKFTSATTSARSRKTSNCRQRRVRVLLLIADYTHLTTGYETARSIGDDIRKAVLYFLAVGIDPAKSTLYLQSLIRGFRAVPAIHHAGQRHPRPAASPR